MCPLRVVGSRYKRYIHTIHSVETTHWQVSSLAAAGRPSSLFAGQSLPSSAPVAGHITQLKQSLFNINGLFVDADEQLFSSILANNEHMLHSYMPERATPSYQHHYLRPQKHSENTHPQNSHTQRQRLYSPYALQGHVLVISTSLLFLVL